jgi:hypothetical protein
MLHKIWRFIRSFFEKGDSTPTKELREEPLYKFKKVEAHLPETLEVETLYVLTEDGVPWEAAMTCPSGCGERLELNLLPDQRPRWRYSITGEGVPSLYPSIDREIGCMAHFFLRNGKVVWV